MANKVAISFGIVMAVFFLLALTLWAISAIKHSRHNTASHNQQHHAQVDAIRRKTFRNSHVDRDVEMQIPAASPLSRRPQTAYVRSGPSGVSRMYRLDFKSVGQRVQFCDVPLTPAGQGQRDVTPAGFF
jgi:Na+-transporting methylmalonyl-CoA/oxaloacetate decarboxylase gamma subunit